MPHKTDLAHDKTALTMLRPGEAGQVRAMEGGQAFLSRLVSLGFTPGARLRMIQNFRHGPLIVAVRDTRVALGRGEASRILVEPLAGGEGGNSD